MLFSWSCAQFVTLAMILKIYLQTSPKHSELLIDVTDAGNHT